MQAFTPCVLFHNKYRLLKKAKSTLGQIMILALCISGQVNAETEKKAVNFSRGFMNFYDSGLFAGINEMGQVPNFRKLLNTSSL